MDGTVLDTSDPASVESFKVSHADLIRQVSELAAEVSCSTLQFLPVK